VNETHLNIKIDTLHEKFVEESSWQEKVQTENLLLVNCKEKGSTFDGKTVIISEEHLV
jgi:hypothetical protein